MFNAAAVPVAFVKTTLDGVPRAGVISVGEVLNTRFPVPVEVVTPLPPFKTLRTPPKVIAPLLIALGVSPVVPALNVVTPMLDTPNCCHPILV